MVKLQAFKGCLHHIYPGPIPLLSDAGSWRLGLRRHDCRKIS